MFLATDTMMKEALSFKSKDPVVNMLMKFSGGGDEGVCGLHSAASQCFWVVLNAYLTGSVLLQE